jgi:hypothetical protein
MTARVATLAIVLTACAQAEPAPIVVLEPRTREELVFRDPQQCRECHPQHVADWEGSMHAYAEVDPVFRALADVVASDFQGQVGQLCTQCHTVPGFLGNETVLFRAPDGQFAQRTAGLSPVAQAGVSCDVCHQITAVRSSMNGGIVVSPDGTIHGPISDPMATNAHASVDSPLHRSGQVCVGCHSFVLPIAARPVTLENTSHEWQNEYLAGGGDQQCQDCHMPTRQGQAAVGGPTRTVHAHTFAAVDVALVDFPDRARQRALVDDLLSRALGMTVAFEHDASGVVMAANVTLTNHAGHAIPSGVSVERRVWVEMTLENVTTGAVVWSVGGLDPNGDLMDGLQGRTLDPNLWWLGTIAYDDDLSPPIVVTFSHRATRVEEHLLRPFGVETRRFVLPTLATGRYELSTRVLMRPMQPHFIRALEMRRVRPLAPGLLDVLPTFVMASETLYVDVP